MKQPMTIFVIVDISGSMQEMAKILLSQHLVSYIFELATIQERIFPIEIQLFTWNESITKVQCNMEEQVPVLIPSGKADLNQLKGFLDSQALANDFKAIILSDGMFSLSAINNFKLWLNKQPRFALYTVAIGADSNIAKLKEISTNNHVYSSENITTAIYELIWDGYRRMEKPFRINDVIYLD